VIVPLLAAAAAIWAAMLPAAAYAASQPAGSRLWHSFALAVYSFGAAICHQRPERSFHLAAAPWPVCARCAGIYFGAAGAAIVLAYVVSPFRRTTVRVRQAPDTTYVRIVLALAALPLIVSLVYEWTTGDTPSNAVRATTGAVLGAVVAFVVLDALSRPR
jgi:uncharacterized membrane protein